MNFRYLIAAFLFLIQPGANADTWSVRADSWCPYNCEPNTAAPGYMIEILELAAKADGHSVEYKHMPWSRALAEAREGRITGLVGLTGNDREGLVITDKMGVDSTCFFVNEGDTFKYTGVQDLAKIRSVGTVQSYEYVEEFMAWEKTNASKVQATPGNDALIINAKKLKANRIQAFIENTTVVDFARKANPELKGIVSAGCFASVDLYAGFSAKNPKAQLMAKATNAKMAELKKSGGLAKILAKYGVAGW